MYNYTNNMNFYNDLLKTVLDIIMHKTGMEIDEINQKETCSSKYYTHATHSNSCQPISRTRSMGNER